MTTATTSRPRKLWTGVHDWSRGGRRRGVAIATTGLLVVTFAIGLAAPAQAYTAPTAVDFGVAPINQTTTIHIPITPDAGLIVAAAQGSGISAPWKLEFGTCPTTSAGEPCEVTESVTPQLSDFGTTGQLSADLTLLQFAPGAQVADQSWITIHLTAFVGIFDHISGNSAFGSVPIGKSVSRDLVYTMDHGFSFGGAVGSGGTQTSWTFSTSDCAGATNSCTVRVSFTPSSVGAVTDQLTLKECEVGSFLECLTTAVDLTGTGVAVTGGTMSVTPGSVDPTDIVSATSTTPCPDATTSVALSLYGADGALLARGAPPLVNGLGDWAGPITVPSSAPPGPEFVSAECLSIDGYVLQYYNFATLSVRRQPTTTALTTSANPTNYGHPITLAANVDLQRAGGQPHGTISFRDGATQLGAPVTVDEHGHATLTAPQLPVGTHTITAAYVGNQLSSSATLSLVVRKAPTVLVTGSARRANPTVFGALLMSDGAPVAGQSISFTAKNVLGLSAAMCTATTGGDGVATCTGKNAAQLALDTSYTATYAGNVNYLAASATAKFS